jgi:cytochrome c-type biogenesis protein CcmH
MLMFWVSAATLCLVTVLALAAVTAGRGEVPTGRSAGALAIYKDQLLELDRDVTSGIVTVGEAEAQRTEISRRLLAAGREVESKIGSQNRFPKFLVLAVPILAAAIYYHVGRHDLPDVPRAERLAAAETSNDWDALIARVEQQLEKNPGDMQGWQLLVPNYLNMGRFGDAARAMGKIAEISGPTAELYANMAEAFVFENKGLMTAQTVAIIAQALKLDPKHPKALYYDALGLLQDGKSAEAKAIFQSLLARSPQDAPWRPAVEQQLAKLEPNAAAPQLSPEQMQSAQTMTPENRMAMIRSMVDGLDAKLKTNPDDVEGWLRLIRARTVLKEDDKAAEALATARTTFATNPANVKMLNDLAIELKLK